MNPSTREVLEALAEELVGVVGMRVGVTSTISEAPAADEGQWAAVLQADGRLEGTCHVAISQSGAAALTAAVLGIDDGADGVGEESIADTVREIVNQAAEAFSSGPAAGDMRLTLTAVEIQAVPAVAEDTLTWAVSTPGVPVALTVTARGALAESAVSPAVDGPAVGTSAAQPSGALVSADGEGDPGIGPRIDVILDIDLPVVVRFGRTDLELRALGQLGPGSVIELGRSPDDPVELLVGDRVVARGEVVIVGGNYGVRILDVMSPSEAVSRMEGIT